MKKKKLLCLTALALMVVGVGTGVAIQHSSIKSVSAEGEVVVKEQNEEEWEKKVKDFVNNYIVPLTGGLSIATVLTAVISITLAIFNRKTNLKIKESSTELFNLTNSVINLDTKLKEEVQNATNISEEAKVKFLEESEKLLQEYKNEIAILTTESKNIVEFKKILVCLCQIQNELSKIDPKAVSTGAAEKIAELNSMLNRLK